MTSFRKSYRLPAGHHYDGATFVAMYIDSLDPAIFRGSQILPPEPAGFLNFSLNDLEDSPIIEEAAISIPKTRDGSIILFFEFDQDPNSYDPNTEIFTGLRYDVEYNSASPTNGSLVAASLTYDKGVWLLPPVQVQFQADPSTGEIWEV